MRNSAGLVQAAWPARLAAAPVLMTWFAPRLPAPGQPCVGNDFFHSL